MKWRVAFAESNIQTAIGLDKNKNKYQTVTLETILNPLFLTTPLSC